MRRRLSILAALALTVSSGAGCADDVAPAARIGDRTITTEELLDEVAEWARNAGSGRAEALATTTAPGSYPQVPVGSILQERILLEMLAPAFDELGLELTEEMRDDALTLLVGDPAQAEAALGGFSDEYARSYVDGYAKGVAVQTQLGEEAFLALVQESALDVEISPRYGRWDSESITVIPPAGPRPAPGTDVFTTTP